MENTKTKKVMTALKGRSGFGSKKGVALLAIVKKLTDKRNAAKSKSQGSGESPASQAFEKKMV